VVGDQLRVGHAQLVLRLRSWSGAAAFIALGVPLVVFPVVPVLFPAQVVGLPEPSPGSGRGRSADGARGWLGGWIPKCDLRLI
jgi:hypothetical protein